MRARETAPAARAFVNRSLFTCARLSLQDQEPQRNARASIHGHDVHARTKHRDARGHHVRPFLAGNAAATPAPAFPSSASNARLTRRARGPCVSQTLVSQICVSQICVTQTAPKHQLLHIFWPSVCLERRRSSVLATAACTCRRAWMLHAARRLAIVSLGGAARVTHDAAGQSWEGTDGNLTSSQK